MENGEDRRKFPRFNLLVDVSVTKRASSEKEQIFPSKNISQGGVCIVSFEQPKMGALMDLKIRLPGVMTRSRRSVKSYGSRKSLSALFRRSKDSRSAWNLSA
jgi:hypothetical protein